MGIFDGFKRFFGGSDSEPIELKLDNSFELKKAFDAQRVGIKGRPQYPDTNFENLFRAAYRSELVFACLEKIRQAALDPEIIVERRNADGWETVPDHDLTALMAKPNDLDTGDSFLGAWLVSEHIADRAVAEIVRSNTGKPVQLWLLNPARIRPVASGGRGGNPVAYYEYQTENGRKVELKKEDVLIRVNRSITNQFYGISPLAVALGSVDADSAMTDYVRAFFNNSGMPSGILKFINRTLKEDEAELMRQQWRNRYGRGSRHERGIGILDQNSEFQKVGSNLDELESDSITGRFETKICQVFGVPPILVGAYVGLLHVNQRASVREAQADFWLNKMSPLFKSLRQFLTWQLLPEFEDIERIKRGEIRVNWNMSQVLALQEDTDKRHDRARKNVLAGIWTVNEARTETGKKAEDEGDYYLRPSQAQLQTAEVAQALAEMLKGEMTEGDIQKALKLLGPGNIEKKTFNLDGLILGREPNALENLLDLKSYQADFESGKTRVSRILLKLRDDLLTQAFTQIETVESDKLHTIILTPPGDAAKNLKKALSKAKTDGRAQVAREIAAQKKSNPNFEIKNDSGDETEILSDITISRIIAEIQARFSAELAAALVLGYTGKDLINKLKNKFKEMSVRFFENIAARAAQKAINLGREAEMDEREDEIKNFRYSAIFDKNLCEYCKKADGKTGTKQSDLPRVPNPNCEGGDQCRCFHIAISK